jgi:arylsulfatase A-like enzyme
VSDRPPNVVLIVTDQQRYDSLPCNGNPFADTPNLDRLAAEGTVCRRYVSGNSVCMPSRASLLTGMYPAAHGVWTNGVPLARRGYRPETDTRGGERVGQGRQL